MQIAKEDIEYPRAMPCGDDRCGLKFTAELTHTVIALCSIGPLRSPCISRRDTGVKNPPNVTTMAEVSSWEPE